MQITYTGSNETFFGDAFFDNSDSLDSIEVTSPRGVVTTQVVVENSDTGMVTTLTGTNLFVEAGGDPTQGTITGISFAQGGQVQGTVSGISWSATGFLQALLGVEGGNYAPLAALINAAGPVNVDATGAQGAFNFRDIMGPMTNLVTQPITYTGSDFYDRFQGAAGNDSVRAGAADNGVGDYDSNVIFASPGNDTIDFGGGSETTYNYVDYGYFGDPLTFNIDGEANTGTVTGNGPTDAPFTDIWLNTRAAMREYDGLGFNGGIGNDVFNVVSAEDGYTEISGMEGNDTFNITNVGTIRLTFLYGLTQDPFTGLVANLETGVISNDGLGGTDQINYGQSDGGQIQIRGTDNNDYVLGSSGNNYFIPEQGNDTFDGAEGSDEVRYDRSGVGPVNVDLGAGTATGTWDGNAFTDTLISVERVRGSREGDDTLTGNASDNRLQGRGGDDVLTGLGGDDELLGDEGNDTLYGGTGDDFADGYDGNDLILGGAGDDTLRGRDGNDTLRGDDGRDRLEGGDGDDLIDASGGDAATQSFGDYIRPGLGSDTIIGHAGLWATGEGADLSYSDVDGGVTINVTTTDGAGTVTGANGQVNDNFTFIHYFEGTRTGDDSITGSTGDHWEGFAALGGNDTIDGGTGNGDNLVDYSYEADYFDGNGGPITVNLNAGTATDSQGGTDTLININQIRGTRLDDSITAAGMMRNTYLAGDDGNDSIAGGLGNDWIEGGSGADTLSGAGGNDVLIAGDDNDLAYAGLGDDSIEGNDGQDTLYGAAGNDTLDGGNQDDLLGGGQGNDVLYGGDGDDALWTTGGDDTARGDAGNDTLGGAQGNDSLHGGDGSDELWGAAGNDTLEGGEDADTLGGADGDDSLDGGAGNDELWGGVTGNDTLRGGDGDDQVGAGPGNDIADGGAGNDSVYGGTGNDTVSGGAGDDAVYGAGGDDWLSGGAGSDTLFAGPGNDTVSYGVGDGADELQFFSLTEDRLELDDALWTGTLTPFQVADTLGSVVGADYVLDFGGGDTVTLVGAAADAATIFNAIDIV